MRTKSIKLISLILITTIAFAGCSSAPNLTEEQNELVSEYAAGLLLKYDSSNNSRLVDVTKYITTYDMAVKAREESIKAYEEEQARLEDEKRKQDDAQTQTSTTTSSSSKDDSTGGATVIYEEQRSIAEFLQADGFSVVYAGNEILSKYPEDSSRAVYPSSQKNFLVVYFNVSSSNESTFDVMNQQATFKISVNGGSYILNDMTVLDDDMSNYMDTFKAGETKRLVLLFELPKDVVVSSLNLYIESIFSGSMETTLLQ